MAKPRFIPRSVARW